MFIFVVSRKRSKETCVGVLREKVLGTLPTERKMLALEIHRQADLENIHFTQRQLLYTNKSSRLCVNYGFVSYNDKN